MQPTVIFEDTDLLVIGKPSGWIVNESESAKGDILQTWLGEMDYPLSGSRDFRSGIVHRLDKETSGILLVAKTEAAFINLQAQFKERKVQKSYIALVHGKPKPGEGKIEAPVGRLPWRRDRFGILPGGREAATSYKTIATYKKGESEYSLIEAYPKTGRTHQIRVHFKYLGHPVVGDEFYAGRKTARGDRLWCPRLFLHAAQIEFEHPVSGEKVSFGSALPADLKKALSALSIVK
jgi:23S rRNA pseudouridine1911/1915/1917 synthase